MNPHIELASFGPGAWVLFHDGDCLAGVSQCASDVAAQAWATRLLRDLGVHVTVWVPVPGAPVPSYAADGPLPPPPGRGLLARFRALFRGSR